MRKIGNYLVKVLNGAQCDFTTEVPCLSDYQLLEEIKFRVLGL
ncbi:MAG: hypothetical protein DF168_00301 [Candidatus Moanabacter tarae]|uniref:Uncharacterized protein n=1 Tax=Candidatus Moanibacter tarae TaxID=2200854 RepID=A0A2Z4AB55_9BACT|nr:MAG: hypothetical protein DF168_00301 [Candidatus Moanabacter tarae]